MSSIDQVIDHVRFVVFENSTQIRRYGFRNRKDVLRQHHRAHFAAGVKTGWCSVKVVPKLMGCCDLTVSLPLVIDASSQPVPDKPIKAQLQEKRRSEKYPQFDAVVRHLDN
ncbi:MAG: hypothetical protein WDN50_00730 [Bradyrhizobium sp.]